MRNKLVAALCLVLVASGLNALEAQRGKIKVVVNEKTGRFVVWGAEDAAKPTWTPLFLNDDPTTSKWKLLVGEKTSVLGDDSAYTTAVEGTATGAKVLWKGKALVATLTLDFLVSANSAVADGLRLALSVVNVSENSTRVGLRWVLDTNLGEKKDHFRLSSGEVVASETRIDSMPEFWTSRGPEGTPGLLVMTGRSGTAPSRLMFANWKRLDDSTWEPNFRAGRDFNLLPYSFNDSAVAQYYDPQDLAPGGTREVVILLGLASSQTFQGSRIASANPLDDLLKKNQNPALSALDQDLASLDTLVNQINAQLANPERVSAEDLKLLQAALDQIDLRRRTLENSQN